MDKLMNAANAGNNEKKLKDGEYVFYVVHRPDTSETYKLGFLGDSPFDKSMKSVPLTMFDYYDKLNEGFAGKEINFKQSRSPRNVLDNLYIDETPGYCVVKNNVIYPKRLSAAKISEKKRVMMVSVIPELIMEDMTTYQLPKWSNSDDIGSAGWFMQKYVNKPTDCNVLTALIFNGVLVDIEWERARPTYHNLLDRLQYFTGSIGWKPEEIVSFLGTGKKDIY